VLSGEKEPAEGAADDGDAVGALQAEEDLEGFY